MVTIQPPIYFGMYVSLVFHAGNVDMSPPPLLLYNVDDVTLSPDNSSEEDFDMEDKSVMPSYHAYDANGSVTLADLKKKLAFSACKVFYMLALDSKTYPNCHRNLNKL